MTAPSNKPLRHSAVYRARQSYVMSAEARALVLARLTGLKDWTTLVACMRGEGGQYLKHLGRPAILFHLQALVESGHAEVHGMMYRVCHGRKRCT